MPESDAGEPTPRIEKTPAEPLVPRAIVSPGTTSVKVSRLVTWLRTSSCEGTALIVSGTRTSDSAWRRAVTTISSRPPEAASVSCVTCAIALLDATIATIAAP